MHQMGAEPTVHRPWRLWVLALYAGSVLVVSAIDGLFRPDNNFAIFRASFVNLLAGRDLYVPHPEQYADLFKYSPTFAFLFAPLSLLPLPLATLLWNALNALLLYHAVRRLLPDERGTLALVLMYLEVLGSMQRAQSNALVAALVLLAYLAFEQGRPVRATLAVSLGALVKLFPLAAASMAVLHPRRVRTALIGSAVLTALIALPLLAIPPHELLDQYRSWHHRLALDLHATAGHTGASRYGGIMEQLRLWFGVRWANWPVQLAGTALLLLPLAVRPHRRSDPDFRLRYLCSLLVYMVIFNNQSESPSFVIAMTGIAIWYVAWPRTPVRTGLMALTVLLVSISSSELAPGWFKREVLVPYHAKTIPCALVWLVLQAELLGLRATRSRRPAASSGVDPVGHSSRPRSPDEPGSVVARSFP